MTQAKLRTRDERGATLVAAVLTAAVMMGFTYLYFVSSRTGQAVVSAKTRTDRLFYLAEAGIGEGIDHLNLDQGEGKIDRTAEARWSYMALVTDRGFGDEGQEIFEIASTASVGSSQRTVDALVENLLRPAAIGGAVQCAARCFVVGTGTTLDGRDHDPLGLGFAGPGVPGVSSGSDVIVLSSPSIGGNGIAPMLAPDPDDGVFSDGIPFGDLADNDGDGSGDEELLDGIDNDGDGAVDEDLAAFFTTPDEIFNLPGGTLKRDCERRGTYFETAQSLNTHLALNGGLFPSGEVIYLEASWDAASFGSLMNASPSLLVVHDSELGAKLGNMNGRFRGLIVADSIEHTSGDVEIMGAVVSLKRAILGSPIGLSSIWVKYSSEVLLDLPRVPYYALKAWRDVPGSPIDPVTESTPTEHGLEPPEDGALD